MKSSNMSICLFAIFVSDAYQIYEISLPRIMEGVSYKHISTCKIKEFSGIAINIIMETSNGKGLLASLICMIGSLVL